MITTELKEKLTYHFQKLLDQWEDLECCGFCEKDELISLTISDLKLATDLDEEAYDELWDEVAKLFWEFLDDYDSYED